MLAASALAPSACSNELDDLIERPAQDAGARPWSAADPAEPPWLPILPDQDVIADCEACARSTCERERADCLEDSACTAQLECMRTCSDPACAQRCRSTHAAGGWWSPYWEDLFVCAYGSCRAECNTGANWGCSQRFDWPRADSASLDVHARFWGTSATARVAYGADALGFEISGARVRVCSLFGGCEGGPFDEGVLDASGGARLAVPVEGGAETFAGHFEVESEEAGRFQTRYRVHLEPIGAPTELRLAFIDSAEPVVKLGWRPEADAASMWTYVVDCTVNLASGVRMAVAEQPAAEVTYLTRTLELRASETEAPVGIAFLPRLALATQAQVTVRALLADAQVAARRIPLRAGVMTQLSLGPLARGEP